MNGFRKSCLSFCLAIVAISVNAKIEDSANNNLTINDSSHVYDIEEIVVVAQPKEVMKLRMQPSSSTSFSSADMKQLGMHDLRDISAHTPAFTMPDYGSRLTSSAYIRGTGSRINNPAIGIYYDGIPIVNKSAYNFYTYGLDRVDIVRGPQGTLYGQNTEGGLIKMYTRNPLNNRGTDIRLGIGTHLQRNAEVAHHTRFGNNLALTVAGFYNGWNGFLRNATTNERADKMNEAGGRVRLMFTPKQNLSFDLVSDYQYVDQNGFAYGKLNIADNTTEKPATTFQSSYRRNMLNTGLTVRHSFAGMEMTSTTSHQYLNDRILMDQDYTAQDYMSLSQKQLQNALTEELCLKSNSNSKWQWASGAFFSYQWLKTSAPVDFGEATTRPIANGIKTAMERAMTAMGRPVGDIAVDVTMTVPGLFHTPQLNAAVFHETNLKLTDRLTATAGLRYDFNRVAIDYDTKAAMDMTATVMGRTATYTLTSALLHNEHTAYQQLLPKLALTFETDNNNSNIYATVSKGYRAGGYNIQMFSDILRTELNANSSAAMSGSYDVEHTADDYNNIKNTIAYKPETSWNYEIGLRQNLFDNTVHIDLAAYYMSIRNQQLSVMAGNYGYGRRMVNAGRSRSIGFETSVKGIALDSKLSWTLSYAFTHATFRSYQDSEASGSATETVDYKGKRVPYIPTNTLGLCTAYRLDLNNSALRSLTFGVNMTAQGKTYWNEANTYAQPLYVLIDANINGDIGFANISLWCKNMTNTRYNTFAINSAATGTEEYFAQRGRPIHCGVSITMHI